jgi:ribulose-5-phosphate 4-epimerase/fuculose-1-phosphate aldolase
LQGDFTGSTVDSGPGEDIARALGPNKLVILQNHGLMTVGTSVEEAAYWFISAEKCCQSQLAADAAAHGGKTLKVSAEDAQRAHDTVGSNLVGWFSGLPAFEDMIDLGGPDYLL